MIRTETGGRVSDSGNILHATASCALPSRYQGPAAPVTAAANSSAIGPLWEVHINGAKQCRMGDLPERSPS